MSDFTHYAQYFAAGMKVSVGIPMPNAEVFRDWAIIYNLEDDLIDLQLSRDTLPEGVKLEFGAILDIRGGKEGYAYSCRAIIISESDARELILRFIGEVVSDELREFYRIDAFLPVIFKVPETQNADVLHEEWEKRRAARQAEELERLDKTSKERQWVRKHSAIRPHEETDDGNVSADSGKEPDEALAGWDNVIPVAANISGGGVRFVTDQVFKPGSYVLLEVYVPAEPPRVMDIVSKVVMVSRNFAAGKDREFFNVAMQFVFVEERDRDAIIKHISNVQLKRIRLFREKYINQLDIEERDNTAGNRSKQIVLKIVAGVFLVFAIAAIVSYFIGYATDHPKGEIERTFEEALLKYLGRSK